MNPSLCNMTVIQVFILVSTFYPSCYILTGSVFVDVPIIDSSAELSKSAVDRGGSGVLRCEATGGPNVTFKWFREGREITGINSTTKYKITNRTVNPLTWRSVLTVETVEMQDYGPYWCEASNIWGSKKHQVILSVTSKPESPTRLEVISTTYNSVILAWQPGFDGGFQQYYRIRWDRTGTEGFQFVDVYPHDATQYEVTNLMMDTHYTFSIMAFNRLGESPYSTGTAAAKTTSKL